MVRPCPPPRQCSQPDLEVDLTGPAVHRRSRLVVVAGVVAPASRSPQGHGSARQGHYQAKSQGSCKTYLWLCIWLWFTLLRHLILDSCRSGLHWPDDVLLLHSQKNHQVAQETVSLLNFIQWSSPANIPTSEWVSQGAWQGKVWRRITVKLLFLFCKTWKYNVQYFLVQRPFSDRRRPLIWWKTPIALFLQSQREDYMYLPPKKQAPIM